MSVLGIAHKEDDLESGKWAKSMSTLNDEKFLSEKNLGQRKIKAEENLVRWGINDNLTITKLTRL